MIELYVAENGRNENDGSKQFPFADIFKAQEAARKYLSHGKNVTIIIREGKYELTSPLAFGEADCSAGGHLTVKGFDGERVSLLGGTRITEERFSPASEEEKARLIDTTAAKNLMRIDLSDKRDSLYEIKNNLDGTYIPTALFMGDTAMWHARYPKRALDGDYTYGPYVESCGYKYETEAKNKSVNIFFESNVMNRVQLWSEESKRNLWINGFPKHEWSDETHQIVKIDCERGGMLTDGYPFRYAPIEEENSHKRYYFFNIFEELSSPHEYYIDYDKGYVYICAENGIIPSDMYLGMLNEPLLSVNCGGNLTVKNINFLYNHTAIASISSSKGILIDGCTFAHCSDSAVKLTHSSDIKIINSNIYDTQRGGILISSCGQRQSQSNADILIDRCEIHEVDRIYQCYNTCVKIMYDVCGVTVTHNKIYNSTHNLIGLGWSNNVEIAYNEIFNGCTDTDDSSVIYWGRCPSTLGHRIHDNYFHHCECKWATFGTALIYQDDTGTGAEIYNNIIYKCGSKDTQHAGIIKGHVFHHTFNNMFIDVKDDLECTTPFGTHIWFPQCAGAYSLDADTSSEPGPKAAVAHWFDILARDGFFSAEWKNAYRGTFWQKLYDRLPLKAIAELDALRESIKHEPVRLQNAKLKHFALNLAWPRKFYDGTPCTEENVYDCIRKNFPEEYKKAMSEVEGQGETAMLLKECLLVDEMYWFHKFAPDITVYHDTNLTIALPDKYLKDGKPNPTDAIHKNNFNMPTDKMPNGESIFVEYGKDFTLTAAGAEYIQKNIPGFTPIDFKKIGITG